MFRLILLAACVCLLLVQSTDAGGGYPGDSCTTDSFCYTSAVVCRTTPPRICVCVDGYVEVCGGCKKENSQNCTADSDCASNNCNVNGTNTCVAGLGGCCRKNSECTAVVPNSQCNTTSPRTCECPTNYQLSCNECKKVNGQNCTADSDCVSNNCNDVDGTNTCVAGLGGCCTQNSECTAMVANSQCSTGTPRRCECRTNYKQSSNACILTTDDNGASEIAVSLVLLLMAVVTTRFI